MNKVTAKVLFDKLVSANVLDADDYKERKFKVGEGTIGMTFAQAFRSACAALKRSGYGKISLSLYNGHRMGIAEIGALNIWHI